MAQGHMRNLQIKGPGEMVESTVYGIKNQQTNSAINCTLDDSKMTLKKFSKMYFIDSST